MDNDVIAAAILTAAFVSSQRVPISSGRVDDSVREKFLEYLDFVRENAGPPPARPQKKTSAKK